MIAPKIPDNEEERIAELYQLNILDTEAEKDFDEVVELASIICEVPISLVSLIDRNRQWFKAKKGVEVESSPREYSFCGHAINQNKLFVIEDASKDSRFHDNPFVNEDPNVRFYAGMPLVSQKGFNLGTLCVLDSVPKKLTQHQIKALEILSNQVSKLIELRDKKQQLEEKVDKIAKQNDQLQDLNKMNTEMTSIISHDLRAPVSSVLSYFNSEYFKNSTHEELLELLPVIKQSIKGVSNLIENLLEWSQSVGEFKLEPLLLYEYLIESVMLSQAEANKKNITFKTDLEEDIKVLADASMLHFIIRNLIGNAVKFTENGVILISTKRGVDNKVSISVKDNGIGIPETLKNRIIKGDKKITTQGTQKEKGSGLGLKLINEFLQKHHSTLKIESEENVGSTFSFTLMLA